MSHSYRRKTQQQEEKQQFTELEKSIEDLIKRFEEELNKKIKVTTPAGTNIIRLEEIPRILRLYRVFGRPVLFLGYPGIGKTEMIYTYGQEEARKAEEEEGRPRKFIDITAQPELAEKVLKHPEEYFVMAYVPVSTIQPEDIIGIPHKERVSIGPEAERWLVHYALPVWSAVLTHPKVRGILFLDELLNLIDMPRLKTILMQILGPERRLGTASISPEVQIVAAANPPEVSGIAEQLPAPIVSRIGIYYVEPPSIKSWIEYMYRKYGEGWFKPVAAFLTAFPDQFIIEKVPPETLNPYPTPRSWTATAIAMQKAVELGMPELLEKIAAAHVGEEAAKALMTFISKPVPPVSEILNNPRILANLSMDARILALMNVAKFFAENYQELLRNRKLVEKLAELLKIAYEIDPYVLGMFLFMLKQELSHKTGKMYGFAHLLFTLPPDARNLVMKVLEPFMGIRSRI